MRFVALDGILLPDVETARVELVRRYLFGTFAVVFGLNAALLALLAATAWGLTRVFGGRGAFIHYGAVLGTIMAGNVAHVAIPGARRRGRRRTRTACGCRR